MTQRKLTDSERRQVSEARVHITNMYEWKDLADGHQYWHGVASRLLAMVNHGTTDGKPYVDPEPPIPDGYRLAVAGDEGRTDCKIWCLRGWHARDMLQSGKPFCDQSVYIVPADRVPTDDDAKSRPEVMVRDSDGQKWHPTKRILILVRDCERSKYKFATTDTERIEIVCWKYCRHLYPGE